MKDDVFLNSYQNASTPPAPDMAPDRASFMIAVDPVLAQAAELARVVTRAHQTPPSNWLARAGLCTQVLLAF
jgi:hypothetical protein